MNKSTDKYEKFENKCKKRGENFEILLCAKRGENFEILLGTACIQGGGGREGEGRAHAKTNIAIISKYCIVFCACGGGR